MIGALVSVFLLAPSDGDWNAYGRDAGGNRYVVESVIDKRNVSRLRPVWTMHTGDLSDGVNRPSSAFECTPIYVDGTLYVVSPFNRVFALDPDTGKPRWTYDPKIPTSRPFASETFVCRGVSTWRNPTTRHRSIFLATYDMRLIALDARTGLPEQAFGKAGTVDLWEGMGRKFKWNTNETSPPCIVNGLVVVGSSIGDNQAALMPSGVVRAYDATSGKLVWNWEPLRERRAPLAESADSIYGLGAANAWAPISADPARDLVVLATGSPSADFSGASRAGDDRDANSVVALRASTGEKLWAFQVVHHDLWDYDVPAQPILADIEGKPAVVAMTKMGHVFVLDRLTGKPLLGVEERPVPQGGIAGESVSRTQPFPVMPKPLVPTTLKPWALTAANRKFLDARLASVRQEGMFTPPGEPGTVLTPGNIGGCNWSGGSYDPVTSTLFVNTNNLATLVYLVPKDKLGAVRTQFPEHEISAQSGEPYGMRREWLFAPGRIPGTTPPWGQLHAIDLNSGALRWQSPLGVLPAYRELPQAKEWGSPNLGGSFVTSSGLVFISAAMDEKLRAFDAATGKVLWEGALPAGGQAAPMMYQSARTKRWYVVQCAGGHHGLGTTEGDSVVAFGL